MGTVDNDYWFEWAKERIDKTIEKLEDSAETLKSLVFWFWTTYTTFYTAGGIFALSFENMDIPVFVIILLGIPIITLIMSYCVCFWAKLPIDANVIPNEVEPIKSAYSKTVKEKSKRLKIAFVSVTISAVFLAAGLFSWFITKNNQKEEAFNAPIVESCLNNNTLFISGAFPENTLVLTTIETSNSINKSPIHVNSQKVDNNGLLEYTYPLDGVQNTNDSIFVSITWKHETKTGIINKKHAISTLTSNWCE